MNILTPEFSHADSRRIIYQLFTAPIEQVNSYDIKRGAVLGDHFHKETYEYFYVTKGTIRARVGSNEMTMNRGSLFVVEPNERHSIEALTESSIMTFLTKQFDQRRPDVHR